MVWFDEYFHVFAAKSCGCFQVQKGILVWMRKWMDVYVEVFGMYVWVRACIYIYTHTHICIYIYIYIYIYILCKRAHRAHEYICTHQYWKHVYVCACICMYVCICICIYIYIYIMRTCNRAQEYICTSVLKTCVCVCMYIYIHYIYMYIRIFARTWTQTRMQRHCLRWPKWFHNLLCKSWNHLGLMYMYVCTCIYVYVYMYTYHHLWFDCCANVLLVFYAFTHVNPHVQTFTHVKIHVRTFTRVNPHVQTFTHANLHVQTFAHV
jgi:hypothetical protein